MKISGFKYLNNNWYDYIMIRNIGLNDIKIDIVSMDKIETIKINPTFYETIKKLNDKEKISEIIRYYLRNNKIYSLKDNVVLNYYNGKFIAIEGTRNLYLQLSNDYLDKKILDEIINKYIRDRYEYLFNNDFSRIEISCREEKTSYSKDYYRYNGEEILFINLNSKDNSLLEYEKDFFNGYIKFLFNKTNEKINYYIKGLSLDYVENFHNLKFGESPGIYIESDKFLINIDQSIIKELYPLIIEHNKKIEDVKKLQLSFDEYE